MKSKSLLMLSMLLASMGVNAQVKVDIDTSHPGITVSPDLYGIFFEDINHAADGGLYAELIRNRSFEDNEKSPVYWDTYNGATALLQKNKLLNGVQKNALEVAFTGKGFSGVSNEGFWGINSVLGRTYTLSFFAKGSLKGHIKVYLGNEDGTVNYGETVIQTKLTNKWTNYSATFTSNGNDAKARLWIVSDGKGVVDFDVVSLFPPTFKNRENGMRQDLAQMLYNLHPKFMRFPGGCFVEGQESPANAFHWETTVGPIEQRSGHKNVNWRYRTSDGMGFHEMLQLSEDLGAKPLYVVNIGLWHGGKTSVDSIQPWIDECMNALEYANGPVTSKYGAMRAANGHPEPFDIEYLEIGNENNQPNPEAQSDHYYDRYVKFRDAVLAKYPKIHLIGNVVAWGDDNPKWHSDEQVELLDEHYYRNPAWFTKNFNKYDTYKRGSHSIYVGEYAVTQGFGKDGNLNAALGEAVYMMGIENNSDVVKLASYAPIFANVHDRMWSPDMIQFDATHAYGTPSYYVQKLMAQNVGTRKLDVSVNNPYTEILLSKKIKPANVQVGFATWATQATFKDAEITGDIDSKSGAGDDKSVKSVSGQWQEDGNQLLQKSLKEGAIAVKPTVITSDGYTFKVKARKETGKEGFIIVFNYVDSKNYCWLNLGGWNNGQHGIEQVVDGSKMQIATTAGHIDEGKWYDVELKINGDSIFASLDGKKIFTTKLQPSNSAGLFTTASLDEKSGEVIVKIANTGDYATTTNINLKGKNINSAKVIRLSSKNGKDENNLDNPTRIIPMEETLSPGEQNVSLEIPAYSLNIVRIK